MTTIESGLMVMEVEIRSYTLATASTSKMSRPNWVWIAVSSLHHIVIVGGVAAGLGLASRLGDSLSRRAKVPIALVERVRTLIYKPHLHEDAACTMPQPAAQSDPQQYLQSLLQTKQEVVHQFEHAVRRAR
jgi:hypothetical protein